MKKFKLFAIVALLATCTTASAQFTNSGSNSTSEVDTEGWSSLYVQYNPMSIKDLDLNGFSLGFNKAFSISNSIPLYVETGAGLQYAMGAQDDIDYNLFSVKIPVSLMYKYQFNNSDFAIAPYAGIDFRGNILGKMEDEGNDANIFDEDDMEGQEAKRFQVGWHVGLNAYYGKVMLGVSYGTDLNKFIYDEKIKTTSITLGYCF